MFVQYYQKLSKLSKLLYYNKQIHNEKIYEILQNCKINTKTVVKCGKK